MRELKFRAWFNRFNKMVYEVDKDFLNLWKGYWDKQIHIVYPDDGDVIEQYTGLKDKNGKEIYEGDIIDFFGEKYPVIYRAGGFWAEYSKTQKDCLFLYAIDSEVIGNIHENPELLGGK